MAMVVASMVLGWSTTSGANAGPAASCRPWEVVSVNVGGGGTELLAVDGVSTVDVWAITNDLPQPTIAHWDGVAWQSAPVESARGTLNAVGAISTTDVWAVGSVILHWDGQIWRGVHSFVSGHSLTGVSGTGPSDVWAVGSINARRGLIEHWDGTSWNKVTFEAAKDGMQFEDVEAVTPDDAWAVGHRLGAIDGYPLIEHWDGTSWSIAPIPERNQQATFHDVDASGPNDVWAVGEARGRSKLESFGYHWNGRSWKRVDQIPFRFNGRLRGVSAVAPDDVWVVGVKGTSGPPEAAHWDGTHWVITQVSRANAWFNGVKAFAATTSGPSGMTPVSVP
jgi:hypothetical protein